MSNLQAWLKQHGAALTAFAGAVGVLVGQLGLETAGIQEAMTGISGFVGLLAAILHAYIQGATTDS